MDGSIARTHTPHLEMGESYSAFMNMDGHLIRRHRSLRNQLCLTRTAAAFLLLVCTSLSAVIYIQHCTANTNTAAQHNLNNEGRTEKLQMDGGLNAIPDPTQNKNFTTLKMFTPLHCTSDTKKETDHVGIIKWEYTQIKSSNFKLSEDKKSLIFHQQGWYQITLQITYKLQKPQKTYQPEKPQITYQPEKPLNRELIHYLIHHSESYPEDITLLSVYDVLPKNYSKSVNSAKMVLIQEGDQLKVKSESMQHLFCESLFVGTANFLMAQLIDPNI